MKSVLGSSLCLAWIGMKLDMLQVYAAWKVH